jgi:hypothetical protein
MTSYGHLRHLTGTGPRVLARVRGPFLGIAYDGAGLRTRAPCGAARSSSPI